MKVLNILDRIKDIVAKAEIAPFAQLISKWSAASVSWKVINVENLCQDRNKDQI